MRDTSLDCYFIGILALIALIMVLVLPIGCTTTGTDPTASQAQVTAVFKAIAIGVIAAEVKDPTQAAALEKVVAGLNGNFTDLCSIGQALLPLASADPKINPAFIAAAQTALAAACASPPVTAQASAVIAASPATP